MKEEGPLLEKLTHRLAECPPDFLAEPRLGSSGQVYVDAVVSDLITDISGEVLTEKEAGFFRITDKKSRNLSRLILVAAWLSHDEWFRSKPGLARPILIFLKQGLNRLAGIVTADLFVTDPDRREELARLCLDSLGLRPRGENSAQAADRLKTLDSVERVQVLKATREAVEHARQVRKKMQEDAAREAAAKYNSE